MWPWITDLMIIVFGGAALFAYFGEWAITAFASVFVREREEDEDE